MAHQVIPLEAGWYGYNAASFSNWTASTAGSDERPALDDALTPAGTDLWFQNVTIRRDAYAVVLHATDSATAGGFSAGHDLTTAFETGGQFRIEYDDSGGTHRSFDVTMSWGTDTTEHYRVPIPAANQSDFELLRGNLPATGGTGPANAQLTIWDGQGTNPFATADTTPPVLQSAETNTAGTEIVLTYDEALDEASVPVGAVFRYRRVAGGTELTPDSATVSGMTVTLALPTAIVFGDAPVVAYLGPTSVHPNTPTIRDLAGNDAARSTRNPVTNNVPAPDTTPPTLTSATTSSDGSRVILAFDEALDPDSVPAAAAFALSPARTISAVAVDGDRCTLTLAAPYALGDSITVAYTQPSANPLRDTSGNDLATFAATAVTNERSVLPYTLDLANVFASGVASRWSGKLPGLYIESETTEQDIQVNATNDGLSDPNIQINISGTGLFGQGNLIDALAEADLSFQNADGSTTFLTVVLDDEDTSEPYFFTVAASVVAAMSTYGGTLRLLFERGGFFLEGKGSTDVTLQPATLGVLHGEFVSGKGTAEMGLQGASLTVTKPDAIAVTAKGNAAMALQAAQIHHTAPADVAVSGRGSAAIALQPATSRRIIRPTYFEGKGRADAALQPAVLAVTEPDDVAVSGKSHAAMALQGAALTVTRPDDVAVSGKGRTDARLQGATLIVTNPDDVAVSGKGAAAMALQAASLGIVRAEFVSGKGTTAIALQPATFRIVDAVYFRGKGSAPIALQPATITFVEAHIPPDGRLPPPGTPRTPSDIPAVQYSYAHARDLTRVSDLFALVITHPDISAPIRVVADNLDIAVDGDTFTALAFRAVPPNFQEGETPRAVLEIDNVGRELTQWIEATGGGRGAMMEVMQVVRDPNIPSVGHVVWRLPALPVGVTEVTNEVVQVALAYRTGRSRPGIKWRHDYETSPGVFAG